MKAIILALLLIPSVACADPRTAAFYSWVDQVTAGAETGEGMSIRLARAICNQIANYETYGKETPQPWIEAWENRRGKCADRARIMVEALRRLNLLATTKPLWEGTEHCHTAVEVKFRGGWHFFDPTYGGYFRDAAGNVCSWAEIEKGKAVVLVEFEKTLDTMNPDGTRANNHDRMKWNYSKYFHDR
jgi:transglutaminase-like putative cysteine protease